MKQTNIKHRLYRICALALLVFFTWQGLAAQERYTLFHYPAPSDTAKIMSLIRRAVPLQRHNPDSAMHLFRQAEELSRRISWADGTGFSLVFMGLMASNLGNNDQAFVYYNQALPYCLQAQHIREALPLLYFSMASSWGLKGNYTKALQYHYKALAYFQKHLPGDGNIIGIYINIAVIQKHLKRYQEALNYINKAEAMAMKKGISFHLGIALLNKGSLYRDMQQQDSAIYYYKEMLEYGRRKGYKVVVQGALHGLGEVALEQGQYAEAVRYLKEALNTTGMTNPLHATIHPAYALGKALHHLEQNREAERVLTGALQQAESTGLTAGKEEAHKTLASVYEAIGRYREALQHQRLHEQLKDSNTSAQQMRIIGEIEVQYKSVQKDRALMEKELKLERSSRQLVRKNLWIAGISGVTIVIGLILLLRYRHQQKINIRDRNLVQLKAMMAGEEKERSRLAKELHDGIGGMLTGIRMSLKAVQHNPDSNKIDGIMNMLLDMGEEIRKTAHNLMPDILKKYRLGQALASYLNQQNSAGGVHISYYAYGNLNCIDKRLELPLYRIVQELVQNIIKHASARNASVQLKLDEEQQTLFLSVEDDGTGFSPGSTHHGMGIKNIKERVKALNGYFSVESAPGMGTTAFIEIDLKQTTITA